MDQKLPDVKLGRFLIENDKNNCCQNTWSGGSLPTSGKKGKKRDLLAFTVIQRMIGIGDTGY